jgi:hypothetical protein
VAPFSVDAWVWLGAVGVICLLAFLYALATLYRDQTRLHDLKVQVHRLRREYVERLARQRAEAEGQEMADGPVASSMSFPAPAPTQAERPRAAA